MMDKSFRPRITNARSLRASLAVALAILAASVASAMARDIFLDEFEGSYSLQLTAPEVGVKSGGTDGSVLIITETPTYDDAFLMTSGGIYSFCQVAGGSALHREGEFSGGGAIDAATQSSDLDMTVSVQGDGAHVTQDFDFDDTGNAGWVSFRLSLTASSGWIQYAYDGESSRIHALMDTHGLSEGEATLLVEGDVYGFIAQLSRFGYSAMEVINLARTKGLDYLREILATLETPYSPGPIGEAAAKYRIPFSAAKDLFRRYGDSTFVAALSRSIHYREFLANLEGWDIRVLNQSVFNKATVTSGETIIAAFKLFHPATGEQLFDPWLKPYASVAQVLPNGELNCLLGYFGYIEFRIEPKTGAYFAAIKTVADEDTRLEPGDYYAFIVLRNPGNDTYSELRAKFTVT